MLRDHLVVELRIQLYRNAFLAEKELTLDRAVSLAQSVVIANDLAVSPKLVNLTAKLLQAPFFG